MSIVNIELKNSPSQAEVCGQRRISQTEYIVLVFFFWIANFSNFINEFHAKNEFIMSLVACSVYFCFINILCRNFINIRV